MLTITIPEGEFFNEELEQFMKLPEYTIDLEHSLAALSKWESKFERPFLKAGEKTNEDVISYIEAMTISPGIPSEAYRRLTEKNLLEVTAYIEKKMTATWFRETPGGRSTETITSELIYHWMIDLGIPFECENWHLSRVFKLIRVRSAKSQKPKKMSQSEIMARNRELNARRKAELGTSG